MERLKYTRVITCPVREEMFLQIQQICQEKESQQEGVCASYKHS